MKLTTFKADEKSKTSRGKKIVSVVFFIFGIILMTEAIIIFFYDKPIIIDGEVVNTIDRTLINEMDIKYKIATIVLIGMIFVFFPMMTFIGKIIGSLKANHKIKKDDKFIRKINPYIYYRELPNEYGIGVCSLLIDSSIENEKDIIATILNLCAKKYIKLVNDNDNYAIHILKEVDSKSYLTEEDISNNLLLNEKYVLSLLKNNDIKNINYDKWYKLCLQDGMNAGIYYPDRTENNNSSVDIEKEMKSVRRIINIVWVLMTIILAYFVIKSLDISMFNDKLMLLSLVIIIPIFLFATYFASSIPVTAIMALRGLIKTYNKSEQYYYCHKLSKRLVLTEKGKIELQKLYAFESFISDFGDFASKNPEEIVLWDRYLSYAVMFGATKKILKSGYKKLVNNNSFVIDNIDNIHTDNLIVR